MTSIPLAKLKDSQPEQHKTSKAASVYMEGDQGPFKCSHCKEFEAPNGCEIVEGLIDPEGCCNLYVKKGGG